MTRLTSTAQILAALTRKTEERAKIRAKQEAEREARRIADEADAVRRERDAQDREATRAHITATVAKEDPADVIANADGQVRILVRDGLLWLVEKRRINAAQRMAGERYRGHYELIHSGGLRSCIADTIGGGDPSAVIAAARRHLEEARHKGLVSDNTLIWLADEVAGKGTTLRELAAGDQKRSEALEAELLVALRFLARHYGFAS